MVKNKKLVYVMDMDKDQVFDLIKNLQFEEAISHRIHSRVFEILGYLSLVERSNLPNDLRLNLESIEDLSRKLLDEVHLIIEYYTSGQKAEA